MKELQFTLSHVCTNLVHLDVLLNDSLDHINHIFDTNNLYWYMCFFGYLCTSCSSEIYVICYAL